MEKRNIRRRKAKDESVVGTAFAVHVHVRNCLKRLNAISIRKSIAQHSKIMKQI